MTNLEDQFFFKKDQEIVQQLRRLQQMEKTLNDLREASGIQDATVLNKLIELDIRPETLASVALAPLVLVAWSDGSVTAPERAQILAAAVKLGWKKDSIDYALLARWLEHAPPAALMETWVHYTEGLCRKMSPAEVGRFKHELISHARAVAQTGGGFFGWGSVSPAEKRMLRQLESAFAVCR